jgi:hypothetical protein
MKRVTGIRLNSHMCHLAAARKDPLEDAAVAAVSRWQKSKWGVVGEDQAKFDDESPAGLQALHSTLKRPLRS